jgi:hypothetical protein
MPVGAFGDHVEHALEGVFAVVGQDADLSRYASRTSATSAVTPRRPS